MASLNKVILIGHLGRDPETRYMANGEAVSNVSLATSETWKDKATGEKKENTEWHRLVFYRKLAEIADQYLKKGALIYVEGRIRTRKWTDKENIERYSTDIEVSEMKMRGGKSDGSIERQREPESSESYSAPPRKQAPQGRTAAPPRKTSTGFDDMDDDIPF